MTPEGPGRVFWINKASMLLGRGRDAAITILDPSISRIHAKISVDSSGRTFFEDLKSANGTFVNDQPIDRVEIVPGQMLRLGNQNLYFDGPPTPDEAGAPAPMMTSHPAPTNVGPKSNKNLTLVLLLLLVAALAAGGVYWKNKQDSKSDDKTRRDARVVEKIKEKTLNQDPTDEDGNEDISEDDERFRQCILEARDWLEKKDLVQMHESLNCATKLNPSDRQLIGLKNQYELELRAKAGIDKATTAVEMERPAIAIKTLRGIPAESAFYASAATLEHKAKEILEEHEQYLKKKCAKKRRGNERCKRIVLDLLELRPSDTLLIKLKYRWKL